MKRVTKGEFLKESARLYALAMERGSNKRLKSARNYDKAGFWSCHGNAGWHFHFWGCGSNKFGTVKAVCLFRKMVYGSYRYFIGEHLPYDADSACRIGSVVDLNKLKIQR